MLIFQSTLPRRERQAAVQLDHLQGVLISIHAPAKGATSVRCAGCPVRCISIHAPAKGATPNAPLVISSSVAFQSTLPRRERHQRGVWSCTSRPNFNPRSREGSDRCLVFDFIQQVISIHAPAKGATQINTQVENPSEFQSTLPRRERRTLLHPPDCKRDISIHAPAKGATNAKVRDNLNREFQSTLPRRERHLIPMRTLQRWEISIHAPAKGATASCAPSRGYATFQSTLPRRERQQAESDVVQQREISIHAPAKGAT